MGAGGPGQFITPDSPPHYLNRLEPMTLLSALAVTTTHPGLVATMTTSYNDPFNLARRLASLELISGGRSGWNVVTSGDAGAAANFSREEHFDYDTRYGRGLEFAGPLNIDRSPPGQPVIFRAGDSEQGRDLGATVGEGIFTHAATIEQGRAFYNDIKGRAKATSTSATPRSGAGSCPASSRSCGTVASCARSTNPARCAATSACRSPGTATPRPAGRDPAMPKPKQIRPAVEASTW
jgi:alkanesulfonate monooxygenase SsuD/methylene tetrahydromethanopterin reductase-like flavin-dependent oxidoreductase (luciferase family)